MLGTLDRPSCCGEDLCGARSGHRSRSGIGYQARALLTSSKLSRQIAKRASCNLQYLLYYPTFAFAIGRPTMADKVKVGVIGVGQIGKRHVAGYAAMPNVEIVAVADLNQAEVERVAAE